MNSYLNSTSIRFILVFLAIVAVSVAIVGYLSYLEEGGAAYEASYGNPYGNAHGNVYESIERE